MKLTIFAIFSLIVAPSLANTLPSKFQDNLIFLTPTLTDGTPMTFFTDTGGGWNAIAKERVEAHQWPITEKMSNGKRTELVDMPIFAEGASIPLAGMNNWFAGKLLTPTQEKIGHHYDGTLGGRWHAEKIIDFDYLNSTISVLDSLPETSAMHRLPLGFQKGENGQYTTAFPSMDIQVDGETLPMLLDTGASATPSDAAKRVLNSTSKTVATSFIVASVFDAWRTKHPDWQVIENGCVYSGADMIEVPSIDIAGQTVGPVWFTRREDHNFHDFMSSMMDRKIDGALGGSALQYVRIIVDYPSENAFITTK